MAVKRAAHQLLAAVAIVMSGSNCQVGQGQVPYTLHYNAEPKNAEIYKDLKPVAAADRAADRGADKVVAEIVRYAKETARSAGYPLSGRDLDVYTLDGSQHAVAVAVKENGGYYQVMFLPAVAQSSHNLQVSIRKSDRKIIAILLGG